MNRDNLFLILFSIFILVLSLVNNILFLAGYFLIAVILYVLVGGKIHSLVSTLIRVIPFLFVLSVAFYINSVLSGKNPYNYLFVFNLRVSDMVLSMVLFREFTNIARAFSFSKTLTYMFILTYSQIKTFTELYHDFSLVMKSRMVFDGTYRHRVLFLAKMVEYFFNKAIRRSEDTAMAMKSRGFFLHD